MMFHYRKFLGGGDIDCMYSYKKYMIIIFVS